MIFPEDPTFSDFAPTRMKLASISIIRLDSLFEISQLAQTTMEHFLEYMISILRNSNKPIKFDSQNQSSFHFAELNPSSRQIVGFSDATFAGHSDLASQLGYIIFASDDSKTFFPVIFKSKNVRRIIRSVAGAELIAFSDIFDASSTLRKWLEILLCRDDVLMQLFTDSKTLFKIISKQTKIYEQRLMLDVMCAGEVFRNGEVNDIGFIR